MIGELDAATIDLDRRFKFDILSAIPLFLGTL
jgi:hypothetical protein